MTTIKKNATYDEAMRFMHNAEDILKNKAGTDGVFYKDAKYIKMACGTAYNAVLLAIDAFLQ